MPLICPLSLIRPHCASFVLIATHSSSLRLIRPHCASFILIAPHSSIVPHLSSLHLLPPHCDSFILTAPHFFSLQLIRLHCPLFVHCPSFVLIAHHSFSLRLLRLHYACFVLTSPYSSSLPLFHLVATHKLFWMNVKHSFCWLFVVAISKEKFLDWNMLLFSVQLGVLCVSS